MDLTVLRHDDPWTLQIAETKLPLYSVKDKQSNCDAHSLNVLCRQRTWRLSPSRCWALWRASFRTHTTTSRRATPTRYKTAYNSAGSVRSAVAGPCKCLAEWM